MSKVTYSKFLVSFPVVLHRLAPLAWLLSFFQKWRPAKLQGCPQDAFSERSLKNELTESSEVCREVSSVSVRGSQENTFWSILSLNHHIVTMSVLLKKKAFTVCILRNDPMFLMKLQGTDGKFWRSDQTAHDLFSGVDL